MRTIGSVAAACLLLTPLTGCGSIPADASVKDFCKKGESFSASTTFETGRKRAETLADVGTPKGIDKAARKGFEQLIDRVTSSDNGADFKKKAKKLNASERANLEALSAYIEKTCKID